MTDREKLIELITDGVCGATMVYENAEKMADRLLSHGVTVREKGEWKEIRNAYGELEGWICECSREVKCKEHFCPACGADMRDGQHDD